MNHVGDLKAVVLDAERRPIWEGGLLHAVEFIAEGVPDGARFTLICEGGLDEAGVGVKQPNEEGA